MKHSLKTILTISTAVFLLAGCQNETSNARVDDPVDVSISQSDVQTIMTWWDGNYDNDKQIAALKVDGKPIWQKDVEGQTLGGHLPITSYYRPIDMPAFGENVIYVEEKTFGASGNPYRQRLYTVNYVPESNDITIKLWSFKDKKKYLGAWKDLSVIKDVKPEDMSPLPDNCDLYVSKTTDNRYYMKMPDCVFGTKLFDYQVSLGEDSFWSRDRIANAETGIVEMSAGGFTYHKLDKKEYR